MHIFSTITAYLEDLSKVVPVDIFTFVGALVEEIIAPIPSPVIMTLAGSISSSQDKAMLFLLWLAFVGGLGKIIGSVFLYVVSDKAEDVLLGRFGKFIGITHKEVEGWGKHFNGGNKEFLLILVLRAIPIVPTAPISVVAGVLKLNFKSYISGSFIGYIIRNLIYLYIGYVGHESYQNILEGLDSVESIVQLLIGGTLVGIVGWMYYKRNKVDAVEIIKSRMNRN